MQLKHTITLAYKSSITIAATIGGDWKAAKVVGSHGQHGKDMGREKGADVSDTESFFISSEIP